MSTRRDVLIGLALGCGMAADGRAQAARSTVLKRLGILSSSTHADGSDFERAFLESLASKGWVEGRNLSVFRAYSEPELSSEALNAAAHELVRRRVDVILTGGHLSTIAAARASNSVPIVFSMAMPLAVEQGLIDSLARPGRNVTGPALYDSSLAGKRLQILKQLVPSATRLAVIAPPGALGPVERVSGGNVDAAALVAGMARSAGFEARIFENPAKSELASVFDEIDRWHPQALASTTADEPYARRIADMAIRRKLPTAFAIREAVDAGGLLFYGPQSVGDRLMAEHAASYVDRILRGASPATLPVELASRYELVINASTAEALGIVIPPTLRVGAEIVR